MSVVGVQAKRLGLMKNRNEKDGYPGSRAPSPFYLRTQAADLEKCKLRATVFRGFIDLSGVMPSMPQDDGETEHSVDHHDQVGDDKNPILERPTVDSET